MGDSVINAELSPSGRQTAVERLVESIGYPERAPGGAHSFSLRVDGAEILAEEREGSLVLSFRLTDDDGALATLAGYAAGRFLREEAALAAEPGVPGAFLWQGVPSSSDSRALVRLFETFMDSCDWWRARVEGSASKSADEVPPMMIRP